MSATAWIVMALIGGASWFLLTKRGNPFAYNMGGFFYCVIAAVIFLAVAVGAIISGAKEGGQSSSYAIAVLAGPGFIAFAAGAVVYWQRRNKLPDGSSKKDETDD